MVYQLGYAGRFPKFPQKKLFYISCGYSRKQLSEGEASMSVKYIRNFVAGSVGLGRVTVFALVVVFLAACQQREETPDVVVVSPSPTTPASPAPSVVVVSPSPTTPASPTPSVVTTTEPITDVVVVATTQDQQSLVNRQVLLTNTPVQSVVGDRTFWVGPSNTQQMFVVLDEALDSGSTEKRLDINAGQTLTVNGLIRPMPSLADAQKQWGLSAAEAEALKNQKVYLQASQVQQK